MSERPLSIGRVLDALREDFPDITQSKVRFLEGEGLVTPARTASGYRQYSTADVQRLRYILTLQRDQYLPLKVIKSRLEKLDVGVETPAAREISPPVPSGGAVVTGESFRSRARKVRLTRPELMASSGIHESVLAQLETHGLVKASAGGYFDEEALVIASIAGELLAFGIEPRHLRSFRVAADREIGLVAQAVGPPPRDAQGRARRADSARDLLALCVRLHVSLVRSGLGEST